MRNAKSGWAIEINSWENDLDHPRSKIIWGIQDFQIIEDFQVFLTAIQEVHKQSDFTEEDNLKIGKALSHRLVTFLSPGFEKYTPDQWEDYRSEVAMYLDLDPDNWDFYELRIVDSWTIRKVKFEDEEWKS